MVCERSLKSKVLIVMRRMGIITKKSYMRPMKVRTVISSEANVSPIQSQQHVFILNKLSVKKGCMFSAETRSCQCGASLNEFLLNKCN